MDTRFNFTQLRVDQIPLSPGQKIIYRDTRLPGFLLVVTSRKNYGIERRLKGAGRRISPIRVTIGNAAEMTLVEARDKALDLLALLRAGINPNEKAVEQAKATDKMEIQEMILREVFDKYLQNPKLKPSTVKDYQQAMRAGFFTDLLNRPVTAITKESVEIRYLKRVKASPARANLECRVLRAVLNSAREIEVEEGVPLIVANPVERISRKRLWARVERRTSYIPLERMKLWWDAVQEYGALEWRETARDYVITMLLTGLRAGECSRLEWRDFDELAGTLHIRNPKNRHDFRLPLGPFMFQLMRSRMKASHGGTFIFPGNGASGHLVDAREIMRKASAAAGIKIRNHDLRRTFASAINRLGNQMGAFTAKLLLNHHVDATDVTAGYVQVSDDQLRAAMEQIENMFLTWAEVEPLPSNVTLLNRRAL